MRWQEFDSTSMELVPVIEYMQSLGVAIDDPRTAWARFHELSPKPKTVRFPNDGRRFVVVPKTNLEDCMNSQFLYEKPIGPKPNFPDVNGVIDDCGHTMGYMCKGHVSAENFLGGIWWQNENMYGFSLEYVAKNIRHKIVRCVPVAPCNRDYVEYGFMYYPSKKGRGAFEATFLYFD